MNSTRLKSVTRSVALGAATAIVSSSHSIAADAPRLVPLEIFTVPAGLEVTVWAQSPMLKNPTNIDIDAQGRIWVTEGVNYRRHKERDAKGDRVVILEDTDKDGRADSSSVFVQEPTLVAPLGIAVIDNRIIVSNAPDMIVYTDVDRDRKFDPAVDKREVLLSGFDGRNHDHALHSVTFGPDGRWYFRRTAPASRSTASTSATATSRRSRASATSSTTTTTIRRPAARPG
jgi:putative membrane-bound dehydrogenase-like protein